jgi:hypothetical protein
MLTFRASKWAYDSGVSGSASFGPLLASGANLVLKDPQERRHSFRYGGFGFGASFLRLPQRFQLPSMRGATLSGASSDFPGSGAVFMTSYFHCGELSQQDMQGAALYIDASAGVLIAKGASLILTGIKNPAMLAGIVKPDLFLNLAVSTATAGIILWGSSEGLVDSASLGIMAGEFQHIGKAD